MSAGPPEKKADANTEMVECEWRNAFDGTIVPIAIGDRDFTRISGIELKRLNHLTRLDFDSEHYLVVFDVAVRFCHQLEWRMKNWTPRVSSARTSENDRVEMIHLSESVHGGESRQNIRIREVRTISEPLSTTKLRYLPLSSFTIHN